jgi:hypothetical protein
MPKAILLRANGTVAEANPETLEEYQALVGGFIEYLYLGDLNHVGYINEDGIALQLPENEFATNLCDYYNVGLMPGDYIKGDMLVFGPGDDEGRDTDVSPELARRLLKGRF